ncbi:unnamed protein product [Soboliphyme baturini]|uniref:Lysophospholipid acyltransferase 5 n=1 Tax=Soboliphyme baturini TaxID=241478 RepID=A0A183IRL5_9BILA|nr:unnamed protein product [Soboliphyme baturini]
MHSVVALLLAYLICRLFGGKVASVWLAYVVFMSYLSIGYVMTDNGAYDLEWTVPHCVLTLRLIGFIFDLYDDAEAKLQKTDMNHCSDKLRTSRPTLLEIAAYMYFYGGCLVGPQVCVSQCFYYLFIMQIYGSFFIVNTCFCVPICNKKSHPILLSYEGKFSS